MNILITGADRGLGFGICQNFLENGHFVIAGRFLANWNELDGLQKQYPANLLILPLDVSSEESMLAMSAELQRRNITVDFFISNAGIITKDGELDQELNFDEIKKMFKINSVAAVKLVHTFLPLMQSGKKRFCFVSSEAGSITMTKRKNWYGYTMSKAALNMAVKMMFNDLNPKGFTFRLYHPGWVKSYMNGALNEEAHITAYDSGQAAFRFFTEDNSWEETLYMQDNEQKVWPF